MKKVEDKRKKTCNEMERLGTGATRSQHFRKITDDKCEFLGYVFTKDGKIFNKNEKEIHCLDCKGTMYVVLRPEYMKRKRINAARLMYEMFSGDEIGKGCTIGFKDADHRNIAFDNLYECKAKREGRKDIPRRFTDEDEEKIRNEYFCSDRCKNQFDKGKNTVSYRDLAEKYHCAVRTVQRIVERSQKGEYAKV